MSTPDISVILSGLRDFDLYDRVKENIQTKWFPTSETRSIWQTIKSAHENHPGRVIPWKDLKVLLRGQKGYETIDRLRKRSDGVSLAAVRASIARWQELQMVEDLACDLARAQENGHRIDHNEYIQRLEAAQRAGRLSIERRSIFEEEPKNWIQKIDHIPVVSLPSYELTQALRGGIAGGRPTTILTRTDGGKTSFAVACGTHAVRMGKKVLHVTGEDTADEIFRRYSCCMTRQTWEWVHTHPRTTRKIMAKIQQNGGALEVADFSAIEGTISDIVLAATKARRVFGGELDLIIVDAGDDICGSKKTELTSEEMGDVWRGLTRVSRKFGDCPVLVTTQTNRVGAQAREIDLYHVGESWHKAKVSAQVLVFDVAKDSNRGYISIVKTKRKGFYPRIPIYFDRERCIVR